MLSALPNGDFSVVVSRFNKDACLVVLFQAARFPGRMLICGRDLY